MCYFRMFATSQCSACGQTIAPNEFVMRTTSSNQQHTTPVENNNKPFSFETNHVFHLKCFTCSKCATQLRPGDRYVLNKIYHTNIERNTKSICLPLTTKLFISSTLLCFAGTICWVVVWSANQIG